MFYRKYLLNHNYSYIILQNSILIDWSEFWVTQQVVLGSSLSQFSLDQQCVKLKIKYTIVSKISIGSTRLT